jgi:hypothetical protein
MKRAFMIIAILGATLAATLYLFREPLGAALADQLTADMFVAEDLDGFDPGPAVGSVFPAIRASHGGTVVTGIDAFMGQRGLLFFANRSVDW